MRDRRLRLALASLVLTQVFTFASLAPAHAIDPKAPEAIIIEDISDQGCETFVETYADKERTKRVTRSVSPCAAGAALHTIPVSLAEARASGERYVKLTGDRGADEAALAALKQDFQKVAAAPTRSQTEGRRVQAASCSDINYYASGGSYSAEGGRVRYRVWYETSRGNCSVRAISDAFIRQTADYWSGEDLYWDAAYYNRPYVSVQTSRDMECKRVTYNEKHNNMNAWLVWAGHRYTDETINDTSLGCSWWGEEYTGSVTLV